MLPLATSALQKCVLAGFLLLHKDAFKHDPVEQEHVASDGLSARYPLLRNHEAPIRETGVTSHERLQLPAPLLQVLPRLRPASQGATDQRRAQAARCESLKRKWCRPASRTCILKEGLAKEVLHLNPALREAFPGPGASFPESDTGVDQESPSPSQRIATIRAASEGSSQRSPGTERAAARPHKFTILFSPDQQRKRGGFLTNVRIYKCRNLFQIKSFKPMTERPGLLARFGAVRTNQGKPRAGGFDCSDCLNPASFSDDSQPRIENAAKFGALLVIIRVTFFWSGTSSPHRMYTLPSVSRPEDGMGQWARGPVVELSLRFLGMSSRRGPP